MEKYNSIDMIKILMAIFVIAIHTCGVSHPVYDSVVSLAVPFFFITMGFFVNDFRCKILSIAKMYVIWSLIYLPFAVFWYLNQGYEVLKSLKLYAQGFIFVGEHYNSWMLWYLLSAIYAMLFIMQLKKYMKDKTILIICFLVTIAGTVITEYFSNTYLVQHTIQNGRIFMGFFFIMLGHYLKGKHLNIYVSIMLLIIGFIINVFTGGVVGTISLMVCSLGLFEIVRDIRIKRELQLLRKLSTDVYLIHLCVWSALYTLIYGEKTFGISMFLITTIVSFLISYLYEKVFVNKIKSNIIQY